MVRIDIIKYRQAIDAGYRLPPIAFYKDGYYLIIDLCGHSARYKEILEYSNFYNKIHKSLYKWPEMETKEADEAIGQYVSYEAPYKGKRKK